MTIEKAIVYKSIYSGDPKYERVRILNGRK